MSGAFWALQGLLLVALVVTAVRVEMERRREERGQTRNVPVQRGRASASQADRAASAASRNPIRMVPPPARAGLALGQFTVRERARLLILRGSIQDARTGEGQLHDDLVPDEDGGSVRWVSSGSVPAPVASAQRPRPRVPRPMGSDGASLSDPSMGRPRRPTPPPNARRARWTGRHWARAIGLLVLLIGVVGVVQTSVSMQALQDADASGLPRVSLAGRLLPGLVANPGKYLGAVNGASSGRTGGGQASLEEISMLHDKQAMDRWEGVALIGLALLLSATRAPQSASPRPDGQAARESSVADDLIPFAWVVALAFVALSFFELP